MMISGLLSRVVNSNFNIFLNQRHRIVQLQRSPYLQEQASCDFFLVFLNRKFILSVKICGHQKKYNTETSILSNEKLFERRKTCRNKYFECHRDYFEEN